MAETSTPDGDDLLPDVPPEARPQHVAIIMDGNGRWAQRRNLPRIEGHRRGVKALRTTTELCVRLGIKYLTLYCFSSENWKRPQPELNALMNLLEQYMVEERGELVRENIRVSVLGRREQMPASALREMDKTVELCREHSRLHVCLAINYGGRAELVDAARNLASAVRAGSLAPEAIDEDRLAAELYTAGVPDPDLLIRTAGEMRISNFLLWQISYAEIWVTDRCWPEFGQEEMLHAIREYAGRERRYGGLGL